MSAQFDQREYLTTQIQFWQRKTFDLMNREVELETQLCLVNKKLQEAVSNRDELHAALMEHEARLDPRAAQPPCRLDNTEEFPTSEAEPVESPCGCE